MAKFFSLSAADQRLFLNALLAVTAARLRLALLPFRPGVGLKPPRATAPETRPSPDRIAWAVDRAARYAGNATCLPQAMAAQGILGRHGFRSSVSIGVARGERSSKKDGLIAHAWVEFGDRVLVGGPDVSRYTRLLSWSA